MLVRRFLRTAKTDRRLANLCNVKEGMRGCPRPSSEGISSNQAFDEIVGRACESVQEKPFLAAAVMGASGLMIGLMGGVATDINGRPGHLGGWRDTEEEA